MQKDNKAKKEYSPSSAPKFQIHFLTSSDFTMRLENEINSVKVLKLTFHEH